MQLNLGMAGNAKIRFEKIGQVASFSLLQLHHSTIPIDDYCKGVQAPYNSTPCELNLSSRGFETLVGAC